MLITIPEVLGSAAIDYFREALTASTWVDGRATAGQQSGRVKVNEQLPEGSVVAVELGERILDALARNPLFLSAALPLRIFPPLFNRYAGGQHFGTHVDNAIRAIPNSVTRIRTDLSATLFISDPESYDGGELVIEGQYGAQEIKLAAGDMVLYPSTSLHHVTPVTRGARVCSFFWMQSLVRSTEDRSLLFDMDQTIQELAAERGLEDTTVVQLSGIYHNLVRRWAET